MSASVFPFRRRWSLNDTVWHVAVNRRGTALVMALDGGFVFLSADDSGQDPLPLASGQGRCLCLEPDADEHAFLAGSADGCLSIVEAGVPVPTVLAHYLGECVTHVASSPSGARACVCTSALHRFDAEGREIGQALRLPAPVTALVYSPDGEQLAIAHEKGVGLIDAWNDAAVLRSVSAWPCVAAIAWRPQGEAFYALAPDRIGFCAADGPEAGEQELTCKTFSSPLSASPALRLAPQGDALFVQGLSLPQAWRLAPDGSWTDAAPLVLAEQRAAAVSALVPHPHDPLAAIGYEDGVVALSPLDGRMEIPLLPPLGARTSAVAGLVWNRGGDCLHAVLRDGHVFLFTLISIRKFLKDNLST